MKPQQIAVSEARECFADLLSRVEAGETIEITRHGVVIARLSQAVKPVASGTPDMDNSELWQLSTKRRSGKSITEQLREEARY